MSGQAVSVPGLLALLEAVGARLTLDGDDLALTGKRPPVALLEAVKVRRAEVLAYLRGEGAAKTETADAGAVVSPTPDPVAKGTHKARTLPSRPDWGALSARPGHCGSCARFTVAPEWGTHMGTCGVPLSGWPGGVPPLAIHEGHRCAAYRGDGEEIGRGYRAAVSGKRDGARPVPVSVTRQAVAP